MSSAVATIKVSDLTDAWQTASLPCDVHKVIPVGLYGLGAYVWRAYFLYRAEPDSPRNEQRATNVESEKQDEHQHQHRTVITIKTLFYIML
jgi:hypothetical protein